MTDAVSGAVAVPANQIHDLHPPTAPSGLYWVVPVPAAGLTIGADRKTITLELRDVPVVDQTALAGN